MAVYEPAGLGPAGKSAWQAITETFEFHAAELVTLEQICKELDIIDALEESVSVTGAMATGSMGQPVVNPAITAIAAHRALLDKMMVSLALPVDGEQVGKRRSPQQKQAANARWKSEKRRGRLPTPTAVKGS